MAGEQLQRDLEDAVKLRDSCLWVTAGCLGVILAAIACYFYPKAIEPILHLTFKRHSRHPDLAMEGFIAAVLAPIAAFSALLLHWQSHQIKTQISQLKDLDKEIP